MKKGDTIRCVNNCKGMIVNSKIGGEGGQVDLGPGIGESKIITVLDNYGIIHIGHVHTCDYLACLDNFEIVDTEPKELQAELEKIEKMVADVRKMLLEKLS